MIDFILAKGDGVTQVSWSNSRQEDDACEHSYRKQNEWRLSSMELALISNELNFFIVCYRMKSFFGAHLLH